MYAKKVEYLKGLMAGLSLDTNTEEYKLFSAVIEALDAFAGAVGDIEDDIADLEDTLDDIGDELDSVSDLMEALIPFGDDDEDDNIRPFPVSDEEDDDDDDESEYEVTCPGCAHVFIVDEETIFKGKVVCPSCKEKLAFDVSGGCGGGCGGCHGEPDGCGGE
ncbi:MAG: hypothetical protein FWG72_02100 [Oscillospiraceae bacterium]|nr:hypothetical protein [Oscillospiraceae bacterium]